MRTVIFFWMVAQVYSAARGDAIRWDQIPADTVGYAHFDIDRGLDSRLAQMQIDGTSLRDGIRSAAIQPQFLALMSSVTLCSVGKEGRPVLLLRGPSQKFREEFEDRRAKDTVIFAYGGQQVHFSSSCLLPELFGNGKHEHSTGAETRNSLSIGLGGDNWRFDGSFFTAFIGQTLIVVALDLPSMATELDVLSGKKPSLATEDSQGLKFDAPPGALVLGAGLSAGWDASNVGTTRPESPAISGGSGFGMDIFGSFKGQAKLAEFDIGENDTDDYADATVTMVNGDAAGRLRDLLLGIKALVSMSQADAIPFINPLEIQSTGNDVSLRWLMPTAKLSELVRQQTEASDRKKPGNIPATQPAR